MVLTESKLRMPNTSCDGFLEFSFDKQNVVGEITARTDHEVEWRIKKFLSYTEADEHYNSPLFIISDVEFFLRIYPNGQTVENSEGWISLYCKKTRCRPVDARLSFGIKKVDGMVEQLHSNITWVFEQDDYGCGFSKLISRSELQRKRLDLMSSGDLTLTCNLWAEDDFELSARVDTLSGNFKDLFTSKRGSDATLVVQGKEFAIHKSILAARSPVFARMFEVDMKEKRTGIVEISDCDLLAFGEFLMYLYSGKLKGDSPNGIELYKIADKYGVEELKSFCCMSIISKLSKKNVCDAMIFGEEFGEIGIKQKAQIFFKENYRHVIPTTEWSKFLSENIELASNMIKGIVLFRYWCCDLDSDRTIGEITVKNNHEIEWSIEDFSIYNDEDKYYFSPRFIISGIELYLTIYPNGHSTTFSSGWISWSCGRSYKRLKESPVGVRFGFGIKKVDGMVEQLHSNIHWVFEKDRSGFLLHKLMERSKLLQRSDLMSSGVLTLTFDLWAEEDLKDSECVDTLPRNLADLFTSKTGSDATLLVQGKEFAVHRSILSARSSVLARMFEVDMKEKRTGVVEISDCDSVAFEEFLKYLYSGEFEEDSTYSIELYKIAHKFEVEDLKSLCCLSIIRNLSTENVFDAVILGEQFNENGIKYRAHIFFNHNFYGILGTTQWDNFLSENTELANHLLLNLAKYGYYELMETKYIL